MRINGGSATPAPTRLFTGAPLHPFWFDVGSPVPVWRQTTGTVSGRSNVNDATIDTYSPATEVRDWSIPVVSSPRSETQAITITSSNEAVATISGTTAQYVGTGSAAITIAATVRSVPLTLDFASRGGQMTTQLVEYVAGSAARNACDAVDSRIAGKTPSTALPIFTSQNRTTGAYVRNPACWCADVDLTCISPWNSTGGAAMAGVLISPRHVLFAAHFQINTGATIRFVTADNVTVTRTMTDKLTYPGYAPYHPDFCVGVLDSDVPVSIGFAKVLPANYATKFPSAATYGKIAALALDQEEKALVADWSGKYITNTSFDYCGFAEPTDATRLSFYEPRISGDSGNPSFLIVNGGLVLLTVTTYGGPGAGTELPPRISGLNALMTSLGGGYQLTEIDLSGFPTY